MNTQSIQDKLKATSIHFIISLIVISVVAYLVFFVWYPNPFDQVFAVKEVFMLLIMVDLILGPIFTFIVYKKNKKTLKIDLTIIGCVQLLAILFGVRSIAEARPSWLIFDNQILYATSPPMLVDDGKKIPLNEQNWGHPKPMQIKREYHNKLKLGQSLVKHQSDKIMPITAEFLSNNKLPLESMKKKDKLLYKHITDNYPAADGYLTVLTEASTTVLYALIDKDGDLFKIILKDNVDKS